MGDWEVEAEMGYKPEEKHGRLGGGEAEMGYKPEEKHVRLGSGGRDGVQT